MFGCGDSEGNGERLVARTPLEKSLCHLQASIRRCNWRDKEVLCALRLPSDYDFPVEPKF